MLARVPLVAGVLARLLPGRRHRRGPDREEGEGARDETRASSALEQGDTGGGPRVKLPDSGENSSARPSDNSAGKSSTPGASGTQRKSISTSMFPLLVYLGMCSVALADMH